MDEKFQEAASQGVDVLLTSGDCWGTCMHMHRTGHLHAAKSAGLRGPLRAGGVSVGDKDFIKPILERKGTVHFGKVAATVVLCISTSDCSTPPSNNSTAPPFLAISQFQAWRHARALPAQVRMKPGKPLTFATIEASERRPKRLVVLGLPGNPVSSLVTFNLVVLPALRRLSGWKVRPGLALHTGLTPGCFKAPCRRSGSCQAQRRGFVTSCPVHGMMLDGVQGATVSWNESGVLMQVCGE